MKLRQEELHVLIKYILTYVISDLEKEISFAEIPGDDDDYFFNVESLTLVRSSTVGAMMRVEEIINLLEELEKE